MARRQSILPLLPTRPCCRASPASQLTLWPRQLQLFQPARGGRAHGCSYRSQRALEQAGGRHCWGCGVWEASVHESPRFLTLALQRQTLHPIAVPLGEQLAQLHRPRHCRWRLWRS